MSSSTKAQLTTIMTYNILQKEIEGKSKSIYRNDAHKKLAIK